MILTLFIRPEAEKDIEEAAIWYEEQRSGLGDDFLDEVQRTLNTVFQNPNLFMTIHRNTKRALIHRFPFGIYYLIDRNSIIVIAVMHSSRHPKRWQKRA